MMAKEVGKASVGGGPVCRPAPPSVSGCAGGYRRMSEAPEFERNTCMRETAGSWVGASTETTTTDEDPLQARAIVAKVIPSDRPRNARTFIETHPARRDLFEGLRFGR